MRYFSNILVIFFTVVMAMVTGLTVSAKTANLMVIDVRTAEEYANSHVKNSLNIDILKSDFKEQILKLDKTHTYKLYCRSGNRSGKALNLMKDLGFTDVENLGSLGQAVKKLDRPCEGPGGC